MKSSESLEVRTLVLRCRDHDDEAFSRLVSLYTPMMRKVISGFSGAVLGFDECFSEAILALHSAAMRYDLEQTDVTFGLYARICVHHRLVDYLRACGTLPVVEKCDVESISDSDALERRIVDRETVEILMKSARTLLSDYEYRVLILHMQGYKTAAIAKKIGKSAKSVDNAKSRLFRRLRGAVGEIEFN